MREDQASRGLTDLERGDEVGRLEQRQGRNRVDDRVNLRGGGCPCDR